jgi:hypothetical protein
MLGCVSGKHPPAIANKLIKIRAAIIKQSRGLFR